MSVLSQVRGSRHSHSLLSWSQTRNQFTTRSVKTYSNVSLEGFKTSAKILNKTRLNAEFFRQKVFSDCFHCIGHKNQCFKWSCLISYWLVWGLVAPPPAVFPHYRAPAYKLSGIVQVVFWWHQPDWSFYCNLSFAIHVIGCVYYRPLVHFAHLLWVYSAFTLTEPAEFSALKVPGLRTRNGKENEV